MGEKAADRTGQKGWTRSEKSETRKETRVEDDVQQREIEKNETK